MTTRIGIAVIRFIKDVPYINILDYTCSDGLDFQSELAWDSSSPEVKPYLKLLKQNNMYSSIKYFIVTDAANPKNRANCDLAENMIMENYKIGEFVAISSIAIKDFDSTDERNVAIAYEKSIRPKIDHEIQFNRNKDYFNAQLAAIKLQAESLNTRGHEQEASDAMELHQYLSDESLKYFNDPTPTRYKTFKDNTVGALDIVIPKLEKHREVWKPILANIGLALVGLGVIYLIAVAINKGFFFNQTKSETLLRNVKDDVETKLAIK